MTAGSFKSNASGDAKITIPVVIVNTNGNPYTSARCPVNNNPSAPEEKMNPSARPEARAIPPGMIRWERTTMMLCTAPVNAPASGAKF